MAPLLMIANGEVLSFCLLGSVLAEDALEQDTLWFEVGLLVFRRRFFVSSPTVGNKVVMLSHLNTGYKHLRSGTKISYLVDNDFWD